MVFVRKKAYSAVKDNVKDFFDLGLASDNNLSFSGGSDKSTFYLGLNALNSNGVYPGKKTLIISMVFVLTDQQNFLINFLQVFPLTTAVSIVTM